MENKVKFDILYYEFGDTLINFFERVANNLENDSMGFNINADSMTNGYISNGDICITYVMVSEREMLYVYHDSEGMICLSTDSVLQTFTNVNGNIYHGYEEMKKEPFEFIQKVQEKLNGYFKEKSKQYHI